MDQAFHQGSSSVSWVSGPLYLPPLHRSLPPQTCSVVLVVPQGPFAVAVEGLTLSSALAVLGRKELAACVVAALCALTMLPVLPFVAVVRIEDGQVPVQVEQAGLAGAGSRWESRLSSVGVRTLGAQCVHHIVVFAKDVSQSDKERRESQIVAEKAAVEVQSHKMCVE